MQNRLDPGDFSSDTVEEAVRGVFSMLRYGVYREISETPKFLDMFPSFPIEQPHSSGGARVQPEPPVILLFLFFSFFSFLFFLFFLFFFSFPFPCLTIVSSL